MKFVKGLGNQSFGTIDSGCVSCPSCALWSGCTCDDGSIVSAAYVAQFTGYWELSARIENSANEAGVITPGNIVEIN